MAIAARRRPPPIRGGVAAGVSGFVATAYGPPWGGIEGGGTTATGVNLSGGQPAYIVAVDPSVIPLGSHVRVWPNPFGYTGTFLAADTGGAIKGNRIDFYDWMGRAHQNAWGVRSVQVSKVTSRSGGSSVGDILNPLKPGTITKGLGEIAGKAGEVGGFVGSSSKQEKAGEAIGGAANKAATGWVGELLTGVGKLVLTGVLLLGGAVLVIYGIMVAVRPRERALSIPLR